MEGLNGHQVVPLPPSPEQHAVRLERIEWALAQMARALTNSGFTDYEISSVNLATRFAIASVVKERGRRS